MKQVTRILKTPSESRTLKQCSELLDIIGDLLFFKQYTADPQTANVPKLCCKYMEIEKFDQNEIIFEFGSVGNKFYIVLQGSVGVYIKKPQSMLDKEKEEKKDDKRKENPDEIIDPLADFMCVKELGDGSAFGELALLNNKPRLATIKSLKDTYVATLSKENFNKILKEHEEQKLNKEIQFFEQVHAFRDFNQKQIRYLCLNNKTLETQKNEIIYEERDPCDAIYVIKEGEFEMYKQVEKQIDQKEEILKQSILSMSVLNKNTCQKLTKSIKIKVLSTGEICGEEFILHKKQREFKLVCSSFKGVIVKIKASDFLRKLSEDPSMHKAFFKRFKQLHEEFEERVQKRILQFHEYKNYLIQDSIPTKIQMSINKLYSNTGISAEKKEEGISEFRQQMVDMENLQKKNEHQQAILSKLALSQRFHKANSLMFQNQVEYLKYKRLKAIADQSSQTPSARIQTPPNSNRQELKGDDRRSSFSSAVASLVPLSRIQSNAMNNQESSPPGTESKIKMNKSMIEIEDTDRIIQQQSTNQQKRKSVVGQLSPLRINNTSSNNKNRATFFKKKTGHSSSENLFANSQPGQNQNLYQLAPNQTQKQEERKLNDCPNSPIQSFHSPLLMNKNSQFSSMNNLNRRQLNLLDIQGQINEQLQESTPKMSYGQGKNKSSLIASSAHHNNFNNNQYQSGQKQLQNQLLYSNSPQDVENLKVDTQLYQFNVSNKRMIKFTGAQKDNFIRDWKKNNPVQEDAQQQSLIRKIKKITSQNTKFSDYFKSQITNLNDSLGPLPSQLQNNNPLVYATHLPSKSEHVSLNSTPMGLILPKIYEGTPTSAQTNQTFNQNTNTSVLSSYDTTETTKKNSHNLNQKSLQMKSIFIGKQEIKEKKKQLMIVS